MKKLFLVLVLGLFLTGCSLGSSTDDDKDKQIKELEARLTEVEAQQKATTTDESLDEETETEPEVEPKIIERIIIKEVPAPTPQPQPAPEPTPAPEVDLVPPAPPTSKSLIIDGLTAIRIGGGIWQNWDADIENDGPSIEITYLDSSGEIISDFIDEILPSNATIKIYTKKIVGYDIIKDRLVFSGTFSSSQIIPRWSIFHSIRIPKEQMNVNPEIDGQFGIVELIIQTPEQGTFAASSDFIVLYE